MNLREKHQRFALLFQGTVIRVHNVIDGTRLFEFRRGVRRFVTFFCFASKKISKKMIFSVRRRFTRWLLVPTRCFSLRRATLKRFTFFACRRQEKSLKISFLLLLEKIRISFFQSDRRNDLDGIFRTKISGRCTLFTATNNRSSDPRSFFCFRSFVVAWNQNNDRDECVRKARVCFSFTGPLKLSTSISPLKIFNYFR